MPNRANSDIVIRPAGPDHADIATRLMHSTHPVLYDDIYQGNSANELAACSALWESPDALESHKVAHGAYNNGALVGVEIGGDAAVFSARHHVDDQLVSAVLGGAAFKHHTASFRDRWSYAFPRFPEGTYYVGCLAVLPEWHGKGVGRLLLQDAFDRAKSAGCRDVQLDLYASNPALHFYSAMGMELLSETKVATLENTDTPLHYRMIKRF